MKPLGKNSSNGSSTENGDNKSGGLLSKMKSLRKKDRNSIVIDDTPSNPSNNGNKSNRNSLIKNRKSVVLTDESQQDEKFPGDLEKLVQKLKDELDKIKLEKEIVIQQKLDIEKHNQDLLSQIEKLTNNANINGNNEASVNGADVTLDRQSYDNQNDALIEKEKELEQLKIELDQKVSTIKQLESDLSNAKQEIINEKSEFEKVKIELQDQKSCVENLTKELSINKKEAQESVKSQSESRVALEVNKHEINELKAQRDQLLSNIQQLNNDLTSSKKEIEKYIKSNQSIQDELKSCKEETEKLAIEKSEKVNLINQLKSDLTKESDLVKKHLVDHEQQKSDYDNLLQQFNSSKEEASKLKVDYENKINQLTSDLNSSMKELEIAKNAKNENYVDKSVQERLEKVQKENEDLNSKIKKFNDDLLNRDSQIKKLNDDLSNRDSTLKSTNLELKTVIDQRNDALLELENAKSELGNAYNTLHNIKNDLENQSNSLKDLRLQLETKEELIQQQKNTLANMVPKGQYDSLNESLLQIRNDLQPVDNLNKELTSVKAELKATKQAGDWEKKRNERTISELRSQVISLNQKIEQQNKDKFNFNRLQQQYDEANIQARNADRLMRENEKLRVENERLKTDNTQLNDSLIKARELAEKAEANSKELVTLSTSTTSVSPQSPKSPKSPKSSSKTLTKSNGAASNGIASNDVTSNGAALNGVELPNTKSKRKSTFELLQSNGVAQSDEVNNSNNQPIPRPKKDNNDDGWFTVKRRSMKRNSTVIDHN